MHTSPNLAVDAIVVNKDNQVLLIQRGHEPFVGRWAFPGGRVNYGEDPFTAVIRELKEETNLDGKNQKLVGVYGEPSRDPRSHHVSIIYRVEVDDPSGINAGDDAKEAQFFSIKEILTQPHLLAFDHHKILSDFVAKEKIID